MTYWVNYALIADNKVKNVAVYNPEGAYTLANMQAQDLYGPDAIAVEVNQYPVNIGDEYINGIFFRGEKIIDRLPTDEEEIASHKALLSEQNESIDNLWVALLEV